MKKIQAFTALLLIGSQAMATTSLEKAAAYNDVLRLRHVEGKEAEALTLAQNLSRSNPGSELGSLVSQEIQDLGRKDGGRVGLEQAIKFATGKKTEIYCEGQGLVEVHGEHNDGSKSKLVLVTTNRKMRAGSASQMDSGDWVYELSNSYRELMKSDLWLVQSTPTSYTIKETRNLPNGKADTGRFSSTWMDDSMSSSFGSTGDVKEPIPMYMAIDYHLWGNSDLGYRIEFRPGYTDTKEARESGHTKDIILSSKRTVGNKLATYKTVDSAGTTRTYTDCHPVRYVISLARTETQQPKHEGKIDEAGVRDAIAKAMPQVNSCYEKARAKDPHLVGRLDFKISIDDGGNVVTTTVSGRDIMGGDTSKEELSICLSEVLRVLKMPPAEKGTIAQVTYPFTFGEKRK